uniref:E3 ubiquitin-protein ligase ZNRF1 n=1 Tax=Cebus imitator TaxID=2715852 RepID=A0A2K5QQN5_CEBIM
GGKQSTAARSQGPFPVFSIDDSAVPPPGGEPCLGQHRMGGGAMGLLAGMGMDPSTWAPGVGGSVSDSTYAHGNGYQETGGASLVGVLPLHIGPRWFSSHSGFKCCICYKSVVSDEMEMPFIMCLNKPRLSYNDDVLSKDAGECVICLEELLQGDMIARLPCLCICHKSCIDSWFEVNRLCPEHPAY